LYNDFGWTEEHIVLYNDFGRTENLFIVYEVRYVKKQAIFRFLQAQNELIQVFCQHVLKLARKMAKMHKTRAKNGENAFLLRVSLRGQAQVQPKDKLDEACTNAEDQMMLVQHRSGDRVMS